MGEEKPREIAARTLLKRAETGAFTETLLDEALARSRLDSKDRNLLRQLVYGVVRWQRTLDWLVARKTDNRPQKPPLLVVLHLGLFQLFWLDRVPNHAAVHESVELAKRLGFKNQSGFVNAVLRGCLREEKEIRDALAQLKSTDLALGHSHPEWLVARWKERWGASATRELLEWNNTPAQAFARINTLKVTPDELSKCWQNEGVEFEPIHHPWLPGIPVFRLLSYPPLDNLASFQQGLFYVQDPSTIFAAAELAPQPGETILDLCAAPGGKTTLLAQLMKEEGEILAYDLDSERLNLLRQNVQRLGVRNIRYATEPAEFMTRIFDRVLLDAPCSNTGVLRRRVDLRWRIKPEEIGRLRDTQLGLLRMAARRVKAGGLLLYSTCSLEEEENQLAVKTFLDETPDFELRQENQLHPAIHEVDGAYVAKLEKVR